MHPHYRRWRVRGVPAHFDKWELADRLRHHPKLRCPNINAVSDAGDEINNGAKIHTLARDLRSDQIATVCFRNLPQQLNELEHNCQLTIDVQLRSEDTHTGANRERDTPQTVRLTIDEHFNGITVLSSPPSGDERVTLLAITGLGSHPFGSFVHKEDGNMWLSDSLPRDVPGVSVMIYGYQSGLEHSDSFADLGDYANSLQIALSQLLRSDAKNSLVLLGHSLGGLLIKEALIRMAKSKEPELINLITGLLFFGVPNNGLDIGSLIPMVNSQPNRFLLESLSPNSPVLAHQKENFSGVLNQANLEILCFYETQLSPTAAKDSRTGQYRMSGPTQCLVNKFSATSCLPAGAADQSIAMHRTHSDLVKFAHHDVEYDKILYPIRGMCLRPLRSTPVFNETTMAASQRLTKVQRSKLNEEQKRILLESLKFDQIDTRQMTIKNAHGMTCQWLMQKSEYIDWLEPSKLGGHQGLLWIRGKPGAGKSTLMKSVVVNVRKKMKKLKDKVVVSFFFNARGHDLEKSTLGMYRSILLQLLESLPKLQDVFGSLELVTWNGGCHDWSIEALKALFEEAVQNLGDFSLTCFIDALDECPDDLIRDMVSFFERLGNLTTSKNIQFRVCFASRHYPQIIAKKALLLILEDQEEHSQDIIDYLNSELEIGHSKLANDIRLEVEKKASGIFMWVVLVVDILKKEYAGGHIHKLPERLREIPANLHELFREILTRDQYHKDELLLCIQWLLFARQPLMPEQLYFAILSGNDPGVLCAWDLDQISPSIIRSFVLDSSKGLAEVTKSRTNPTVQFIHESIKDFLLKEDGLSSIRSDLQMKFEGQSHERLKQCCVNYMQVDISAHLDLSRNLPPALSIEAPELIAKTFPFLEYAVHNVLYHANLSEGGGISQGDFTQEFQLQLAHWIKLSNLFEKDASHQYTPNVNLLYILAEDNLSHLIRSHPSVLSYLDVGDERYGPPLFAALATGSHEAVRAFLATEVELQPVESPVHSLYSTYLEAKVWNTGFSVGFKFSKRNRVDEYLDERDNEMILSLLLFIDRLPMNRKRDGKLLLWAATCDLDVLVKWLLGKDEIEINTRDCDGRTPLSWAAGQDSEKVVQLLLESDKVDMNTRDCNGRTPFSWAAKQDSEKAIQLLPESDKVDTNARDDWGRTPLIWAAMQGSGKAVQLLLESDKVDVNTRDDWGRTPLMWAARQGSGKAVQLFLESDKVDTNARDDWGRTPLMWAARQGVGKAVQLLLESDKVDTNAKDNTGRTPLSLASMQGYTSIVELLLTKRVDIDARDMLGRTPLSYAAEYGCSQVVQLLLATGLVDVNLAGNDGLTPLWYATTDSYGAIIDFLVKAGARL